MELTRRQSALSCVLAFLTFVGAHAQGTVTSMDMTSTLTPTPSAMLTAVNTSDIMSLIPTPTPTPSPMISPCNGQYMNPFNSSLPSDGVFEVVLNNSSQFNETDVDLFLESFYSELNNYCDNITNNCSASSYNVSSADFLNLNGFTQIYSCSMQQGSQLILGLVYFYDGSFITTEAVVNATQSITVADYTFSVQQPSQELRTNVINPTSIMMSATTSVAINSTTTPSERPGGLTDGAIAGIAVSAVVVVAIVVTVIVVAIVVGMMMSKKGTAKVASVSVKEAPKRAAGDAPVLVSHGNKNSGDLAVAEL